MSQKIFASQVERPIFGSPGDVPKCDFLKKSEFLGEFKTEADKARARFNLGLPDDYSLNWGNIRGNIKNQLDLQILLDNINNKVDTQLNLFKSTLNVHSSEIIKLKDSISSDGEPITLKSVYNQLTQLHTDVLRNTGDILALQGAGGDTSLVTKVNQNSANINQLLAKVQELNNRPSVDQNLTNEVSSLRQEVSTLQATIRTLQAQIGDNRVIELELNIPNNITIESDKQQHTRSVIIKGIQSRLTSKLDLTDIISAPTISNSFVTWDDANKQLLIDTDITSTSTSNVTFKYEDGEKTISITVNVAEEIPELTAKQYVGFASDPSQIFENSNFECDSIAKVWDSNTPSYGQAPYYFTIITTQTIRSIKEVGEYNVSEKLVGQLTSVRGVVYNVYRLNKVRSKEGTNITITIQ